MQSATTSYRHRYRPVERKMFPNKIKTYTGNSFMTSRQRLVDRYEHGKVIRLKDTEFKENKFRLVKSINFWNPFVTKILFGGIKGEIEEKQITCEIGLSPLMKGIIYFDVFILFAISIGLLFTSKYDAFIALTGFLVVLIFIVYFRLKSEIRILETYMDDTFGK